MSIESELRELRQLVERIAATPKVKPYLTADRGMSLHSDVPMSIRRRETPELIAAERAVVEAEAHFEAAKATALKAAQAAKRASAKAAGQSDDGLVMINAAEQERMPEFAILREAEERVVKARVRRAKILRALDIEAVAGGESFTSRVARTVGLK